MEEVKKEVIVKCFDNCSCMSVDKFDNESEYFVTFYNSYHDASIYRKIRDIFRIIRGRQINTSEVILTEEDYEKLRNFK